MKALIQFGFMLCLALSTISAQTVKLESHMAQTDWAEEVLLNGTPISESALNNFPLTNTNI